MFAKIGKFSKSKHKLHKFASNLCLFDEKCIKIIVWCCKIALLSLIGGQLGGHRCRGRCREVHRGR